MKILTSLLIIIFITPLQLNAASCLYVSSYHEAYEWDQRITQVLSTMLSQHCQLSYFYMDTKRNQSTEFAQAKGLEALQLIRSSKPDIVIAADDNASQYLVAPYLRDSDTPVVFCGVNTSAEPYGYPYKNATGMVEITPHQPMLLALRGIVGSARRGIFLAADVVSQRRMYSRLEEKFKHEGIQLNSRFVQSQQDWEAAWLAFDRGDFIFVGNPAGIDPWDTQRAIQFSQQHADVFTFTAWDWLAPLAMVTITKEPEEQGEWAAQVAIRILIDGVSPDSIPVITNRRWRMIANRQLLAKSGMDIPLQMRHLVQDLQP